MSYASNIADDWLTFSGNWKEKEIVPFPPDNLFSICSWRATARCGLCKSRPWKHTLLDKVRDERETNALPTTFQSECTQTKYLSPPATIEKNPETGLYTGSVFRGGTQGRVRSEYGEKREELFREFQSSGILCVEPVASVSSVEKWRNATCETGDRACHRKTAATLGITRMDWWDGNGKPYLLRWECPDGLKKDGSISLTVFCKTGSASQDVPFWRPGHKRRCQQRAFRDHDSL